MNIYVKSVLFQSVAMMSGCSQELEIQADKNPNYALKDSEKESVVKDIQSSDFESLEIIKIDLDTISGTISFDVNALDKKGANANLSCESGCLSDYLKVEGNEFTRFSTNLEESDQIGKFVFLASDGNVDTLKTIQVDVKRPLKCESNFQESCLTNTLYQAADLSNLTADKIKNGVTIAGVAGLYPSVLHPLPSASGSDLPTLAANITAGSYQWWKQDGTRVTGAISDAGTVTPGAASQTFNTSVYKLFTVATDANLIGSNIRNGVTVFGVNGAVVAKPSDCSSNSEIGCVTTSAYKSADLNNLTAEKIKNGVVIAGVTGLYPSVLYPLQSASGADLPGLDAEVAAGNYQWWKQDGTRLTGMISDAGTVVPSASVQLLNASVYRKFIVSTDSNLTAANIRNAVTIFGVTGTVASRPADCSMNGEIGCVSTSAYQAASLTNLSASNILSGVSIAGTVGNVIPAPSNCATDGEIGCVTLANYPSVQKSILNNGWNLRAGVTAGGVAGGIRHCRNTINTALFGTAGDKYSTIDSANNGIAGNPTGVVTGWSSYVCGVANLQDVSSSGSACAYGNGTAVDDVCMMRDNISGLIWAPYQGMATWENAKTGCDTLTHGGVAAGTWRLPTQFETAQAGMDGMSAVASANFITKTNMWYGVWTATTRSDLTTDAFVGELVSTLSSYADKTTLRRYTCVSP